ncbi:class I SAM-dependent methyltransferase [Actinokineospora bangkokensis]|uniref:Methyltransferase n=1 Tax=Actinokineospora bangkokensis TaxID=1193682 RepID=A0A1Q9LKI3_9PSEU|nr:class I SAM-dependent methyltransferase [Actinokineospora bangkokensis]OLR92513.1 methyltransferase [Actinokineospora bangkokensis]
MQWFEDDVLWSGFSEVVFSPARAARAATAVEESPLLRFPAGARVLDQCCGPAVFTVPLAAEGYRVTGIDLSPVMLSRAEKALADAGVEAELVQADMREFARAGAFDAIVNLYTSFGYFDDHEDNQRTLQNAYDSLAPGGVLVIDLMGKETYARWAGEAKAVPLPDGGKVFMHDQILDNWTRYRTDWTLVRGSEARYTHLLCWVYSGAELMAMFRQAGFTEVECFGDFDGSPYDNNADRLIVRGRKAA